MWEFGKFISILQISWCSCTDTEETTKKRGGDGKLKLYLYKKENISTTMFDSAVVNVYIAVIV